MKFEDYHVNTKMFHSDVKTTEWWKQEIIHCLATKFNIFHIYYFAVKFQD